MPGLGTEFRRIEDGATVAVDYVANARSLGCRAERAGDLGRLAELLDEARSVAGPFVIVCPVEPRRALLDSGAFWDLGLAQHSHDPSVRAATARRSAVAAAHQRFYGPVPA